ncbi:hypothetical protein V5F59_03420 [Xanthobacter autotrophicus DSM 431]|uniref:hypothetical protein n=1 Tax=Xanthobacter nonsaccharivorans TaxID=3119912 RepID=UPI00372657B7
MIRAVEKALAIFDAFDTPPNSGFLVRLGDQGYGLWLKILRLAGRVKRARDIRDSARHVMHEECRATGPSVRMDARLSPQRKRAVRHRDAAQGQCGEEVLQPLR